MNMSLKRYVNSILLLWLILLFILQKYAIAEELIGSSSANIEQVIQMIMEREMDFGIILPNGSADKIIMSPQSPNSIISQNNTSLFNGDFSYSHVRVYGVPYSIINIETDNSTTLNGPGENILLDDFYIANDGLPLNGNGTKLFYIGGSLNINENQLPGIYSGTFNITASYP